MSYLNLDKSNVDFEIEQFWLGFKESMKNFYRKKLNKAVDRPIELWSNHLNNLQTNKKYEEIEHCITKYISLYAIDLMRFTDNYSINILRTNIKRWDKISNRYKIFESRENYNKGCNLITTLLSIYYILFEKNKLDKNIFDQLELFIFFGDFTSLIQYSFDNELPSIIDKLLKYDIEIFNQIKILFNLEEKSYPLSGIKLFKLLKNK